MRTLAGWTLFLAVAATALSASADDVRQHLDLLRGIHPVADAAQTKALNERMDTAWRYLEQHKTEAVPVVRRELEQAIHAGVPDQFFVLDSAHLLSRLSRDDTAVCLNALGRIDPKDPVIRANWRELFEFMLRIGASGKEQERYFAQADRLFLGNETELNFFAAPHVVKLNGADQAGMVFGVAGPSAAKYLAAVAARPGPTQLRALRIMTAVASEQDVPAVAAVLQRATDRDLVLAAVTVLMEVGGPAGRAAVLAFDPSHADAGARAYIEKIRPRVQQVDLRYFEQRLAEVMPAKHMSDRAVQAALDRMEERNGADDETPPINVLQAHLPTDRVLDQLKRIRARSFRRENNHVFEDQEVTNLLLNALQFKAAAQRK